MNVVYGVLSLALGAWSFTLGDPAAIPVLGFAFGAAGLVRESRGSKRVVVILDIWSGAVLGIIGSVMAVRVRIQ